MRVAVVLVASLVSCGPPSRTGVSLPRADYEYEKAPDGDLKERAKKTREEAATAFIRTQLDDVDAALAAKDFEKAFGIVTSLHQHAISRGLLELDRESIQLRMEMAVLGLIPKMANEPRKTVGGLLGFLDASHDTEARALAAKAFADKSQRFESLAADAKAKGRVSASYLYRALADYYAFRRIDDDSRKARDAEVAALAGLKFQIGNVSGCSAFEYPAMRFDTAHMPDLGREARMRVEVTKCSQGSVIADNVTRESKPYKRLAQKGSTSTEKTDPQQQRRSVQDSSGRELYTEGTGHYDEGSSKTTTTDDVYEDATADVDVHHVTREWAVEATIVIEHELGAATRYPITYSSSYEDVAWHFDNGASGGESFSKTKEYDETERLKARLEAALEGARESARTALSNKFMEDARAASNPDDKLALFVNAMYAGNANGGADKELETLVNVPPEDITLAFWGTHDATTDSPLAYKLPELPKLTDEEIKEVEHGYGAIVMRHSGDENFVHVELLAGLQTSAPTRIGMTESPDEASSSFGAGVGMRIGGGGDPGRTKNGVLGGLAMDVRLGYAGGMFFDASLPVWLGARVNGVGVAATGVAGWNKLGKQKMGDLYVHNAGYFGYGVDASYVSWGLTDVGGSYTKLLRHEAWQDELYEDDFSIIGDETRYELRLQRFSPAARRIDRSIKTYTLRYSSFEGDTQDGRAITFWYGYQSF